MSFFKTAFLIFNCVTNIWAQNIPNGVLSVSKGLDQFALKLLAQTSVEVGDNINVALSPYTIWTLLTIISEGARDNTLRELENSLGLPQQNKAQFRDSFRALSNTLNRNSEGARLDITNAIFTTNEYNLNSSFQQISQSIYDVNVVPVDFRNTRNAVNTINSYIARSTKNRISNFITERDVSDAAIFITSALFFKGQWRTPFNKSATHRETFFNEAGNKIGEVDMMYQSGPFPYTLVTSLKAFAVELPYDGNKVSMIILLPRKGEPLNSLLNTLTQTPFATLMQTLSQIEEEYADEDVEVQLPKFSIQSDLSLNSVLDQIGIRDVFSLEKADLLGIFPHYLYLSQVIQKAVIDVDEEGTVAAAAAGGSFAYKTTRPKILVNKPFVFLLVDKRSESILFAGKITNPKGICDTCTGI